MPTKLSSRISKTTTIDGSLKTPSPHPAQVENNFIITMEDMGKRYKFETSYYMKKT